ncbi:hypothetical protein L9F63_022065, partial [Diploptera punctata]
KHMSLNFVYGLRKYDKKDLLNLREEVRQMFQHAYNSYLKYAYPYDELRPLSCDGVDTWGSYSLTLIDALDTLAVMGNYSEFQRVVDIITTNANFDANINVSVFETNIRIIGGLLSAHLLSYRAGVAVEPGWPCNGPLLQLAEDVARRLLTAFDTTTGMPYGTVNLRHGVPIGETSITCTAGVGTFILEFGTLSRLTGDPLFEEVAMNALYALYHHRSTIGLVGNHIDVQTGRWTAQDAGIGAGVDSYYEYLAKGAILLQRPELMHMFNEGRVAIDKYLKRDDWHLWVSMSKGQVTLPVFQSLEAYWPGVLSLIGDTNKAIKSLHNYHQVWKQYGFTPEYYNIPQGEAGANREGYPLRPELVESVMYLYRATGDPYLLEVGKDILRSIQHSARTSCGYATIKDVRDHRKEDRMESFFLAETTKYLYLLFDTDNFIHNRGQHGMIVKTPWGECVLEAGGYIFNTEAHPIDPGALHCCSGHRQADIQEVMTTLGSGTMRGDPLSVSHRSWKASQTSQGSSVVQNFVGDCCYVDRKKLFSRRVSSDRHNTSRQQSSDDDNMRREVKMNDIDNRSQIAMMNIPKPKKLIMTTSWNIELMIVIESQQNLSEKSETEDSTEDVTVESVIKSPSEQNSIQEDHSEDQSSFPSFMQQFLTSTPVPVRPQFDPQALLERLRSEAKYKKNTTWEHDYQLLSCAAQPFLQRLSMSGEIFELCNQARFVWNFEVHGSISSKVNLISEIFKNMSYGQVSDSSEYAKSWLNGRKLGPFIDNKCKEISPLVFEVCEGCSNSVITKVGQSTENDINEAVNSSLKAADAWSKLSAHQRARHLYSYTRHLQKHSATLAQIESLNRGVQNRDPKEFDVPILVRYFYHYAGWAQHSSSTELRDWKPLGVVAAVLSSSSPLAALGFIIAPALAAGNTICLKPSQRSPLPALLFASIASQAGLPSGVINVLPGDIDVGKLLVTHGQISKVTFCGSASVGRLIQEETAGLGVHLTLLLDSGRSSMLVFDTADLDSAVDSAVDAAWFNQGQAPWCVRNVLIQESIWVTFTSKLRSRIEQLQVGTAFDHQADIGSPVDKKLVLDVTNAIRLAHIRGLEVTWKKLPSSLPSDEFFPPTLVIGGLPYSNSTVEEEISVPLLSAIPFRTAKEAIVIANNTRHGLAASVWSDNASLAMEVAYQLQVGTVWINSHGTMDAGVPFGTWKESGYGVFGGKE